MRRIIVHTVTLLVSVLFFLTSPLSAADIIVEWNNVKVPEVPSLQSVTVDHSTTALLILDIEERTCNQERRPRCLDTVPGISAFLKEARAKKMMVAYSLTGKGSLQTILPGVKPLGNEVIVQASVNKFYGTDLWQSLEQNGIKTVIIVGTAAHGAVLHTATAASSQHKLHVVIPVDGLSASTLYIEQATLVNLITGPGTRKSTTITSFSKISIE